MQPLLAVAELLVAGLGGHRMSIIGSTRQLIYRMHQAGQTIILRKSKHDPDATVSCFIETLKANVSAAEIV